MLIRIVIDGFGPPDLTHLNWAGLLIAISDNAFSATPSIGELLLSWAALNAEMQKKPSIVVID